ncbi:ATP-dependent helicase [Rubinisphaera margarita]|uniref:ATP-dependent helicase n=1 Tax=Rubinisphaera margarita TaxID=2909586 RepID=UPI001EE7F6F4|nr:UvrD-helicase domain-containing protein [Rubinisphaera margarita]MCG6158484.1 UvrD-helicase domain-containing protein [Rubinisphaera margarita]
MDGSPLLHNLTPPQQQAVEHFTGPMLVLAGPGSGKTRVVTHRVARLMERGVKPWNILAITFTNKAASEMSERLKTLTNSGNLWVSTFHRFCAHVLRQRANVAGLQPNFTILDSADQKQAIRQVLADLDFDAAHYPPGKILAMISNAKNELITAHDFVQQFEESVADHFTAVVAKVYPAYQKFLLQSNAVDFDDLLLHVVHLFEQNDEIRSAYDDRYQYVLVDEYQDTNEAQYRIVRALSQNSRNLSVTGDPDQSIYGWRGAKIDNILRFEKDYSDAKVYKLEQNFRSTKLILGAADSLIAHNRLRKAKELTTENPDGEPVELLRFPDSPSEADSLARHIRQMVDSGERKWSDFAIFYRVNSISRQLELALSRHHVPYQVAAGVAFYQRAEVRDLIGYLDLVNNPANRTAFMRVVNTPLRGIGKTSQHRLTSFADDKGISYIDAALRADEVPKMPKRAAASLKAFARMMQGFSVADSGSVAQLIEDIVDKTGYTRPWSSSQNEQDLQRLANVEELIAAARNHDTIFDADTTLEGFLETTSLVSDLDALEEVADTGKVTLMTLHAAKGLEFPVVYIVGVEQNMLPHERALREGNPREYEEERRLLFVGMTRAMERLFLTASSYRDLHGRSMPTIPSDFLSEIDLVQTDGTTLIEELPDTAYKPSSLINDISESDIATIREMLNRNTEGPRLTTGASLLAGNKDAASLPFNFPIGSSVRHPRYGLGTVTTAGGFGARRTVTVEFEEQDRVETFVVNKCPLQPVGNR